MLPPTLEIRLLGTFSVTYEGIPITTLRSERLQSFLTYLLLNRNGPQSRQHISFLLWPDSSESHARANLRNLLHQLRSALPHEHLFVDASAQTVQWRAEGPFTLDVAEFEGEVQQARLATQRGHPDNARAALERTAALYKGPLMPALQDDWINSARERLEQLYVEAMSRLAEELEAAGEFGEASRYLQELFRRDPVDEGGAVRLMRLYALKGDRAAVRRVFQQCAAALSQELEMPPAASTIAAYEQYVASAGVLTELTQTTVAPPVEEQHKANPSAGLPSLAHAPRPHAASNFVGREEELAQLGQMLVDSTSRLVTLMGPGGIGKTRLAIELANEHEGAFADGVLWVSLVPTDDAELLPSAVASATGIAFQGGTDLERQLIHYLADKQMLLVLDNFEHLLEGASWVSALLQQASRLKVLVTSRVRLHLYEEWAWELGGLALPSSSSANAVDASSAVTLFLQSARKVQHDFELRTDADREAVVRVCDLMGGMPLGIELAASWVRVLSPKEIVGEIESSLDFLQSSLWDIPERHRSLRAVFDQSWALLSPPEQQLLRRLPIFQGSFTRQAAEQVAGASLSSLAALTDQSLLRRDAAGWYSLHEVIRQYATTYLAAYPGEREMLDVRHALYFAGWLQEAEALIKSDRQPEIVIDMNAQVGDLRAAWEWTRQNGRFDLLGRMVLCLHWYYEVRGLFKEGADQFLQAVETMRNMGAPDSLPRAEAIAYAQLVCHHGWFLFRMGDSLTGINLMRQSRTLADELGDQQLLYFINSGWSFAELVQGNIEAAEALACASLDNARALGRVWHQAVSLSILGQLAYLKGDPTGAYRQLRDSLALWRTVGDPRGLAFNQNFLSAAAMATGNLDEAIEALRESVAQGELTGDRWSQATAQNLLGQIMLQNEQPREASTSFEKSLALFREIGDRVGMAQTLTNLGQIAMGHGENEEGYRLFRQSLDLAIEAENVEAEASALVGLLDAGEHQSPSEALIWVEVLERLLPARDERWGRVAAIRQRLTAKLSPAEIDASVTLARDMTLRDLTARATSVR